MSAQSMLHRHMPALEVRFDRAAQGALRELEEREREQVQSPDCDDRVDPPPVVPALRRRGAQPPAARQPTPTQRPSPGLADAARSAWGG